MPSGSRETGRGGVTETFIDQAEIFDLDSKFKGKSLKEFKQRRDMIKFIFLEYCFLLAGDWIRMKQEDG